VSTEIGTLTFLASALITGIHAREFDLERRRVGARARGLAAHVEEVGPSSIRRSARSTAASAEGVRPPA